MQFEKSEKGIAKFLLESNLAEKIKSFNITIDVEDERILQDGNIAAFHLLVVEKCNLNLSVRNLIGILEQVEFQKTGLVTVFS
jgi:hypothetical protein